MFQRCDKCEAAGRNTQSAAILKVDFRSHVLFYGPLEFFDSDGFRYDCGLSHAKIIACGLEGLGLVEGFNCKVTTLASLPYLNVS